ncbi:MAG: tetratricopeptide repeat protein [Flammeovirgaceae bacterium]
MNSKQSIYLFLCVFFLFGCNALQEEVSSDFKLLKLEIEANDWTKRFDQEGLALRTKNKFNFNDLNEVSEIINIELKGLVDEIAFYTTPEMGENFHFVHSYTKADTTHLIFGINSDILYNYYDFQVITKEGNEYIVDVLNFYTGEYLTNHVEAFFDEEKKKNLEMVSPMFNDYIEKRCTVAWTYYTNLPDRIQVLPEFTEIKIDVASCISDSLAKAVRTSLIESEKLSAASKAMHQLELGRVFADVPTLQKAIPKLQKIVGEDPFLDQLLPKAYSKNRQFDKALTTINEYLEKYPESEWAHYFKLDVYLFSGNDLGAKQWLSQIKKSFQIDSTYLANLYAIHPELQ